MKKVLILFMFVLVIVYSFSAAEKNIKVIVPTDLDISAFDVYKGGEVVDAKLTKGDVVVAGVVSEGKLKKMKVEEEAKNDTYKYMKVYIKHSKDAAKAKLAISYKNPDGGRYIVLADGDMTEERVGEMKSEYSSSLEDLIDLNESSNANYEDFYGVEVEDKALLSALSVGNEELFSVDRENPSNLLARFIEKGEINFGTEVPVLETESDSFYIMDEDGGLWIAEDTYFDRKDAQLVKVPAGDTITEKYDKPGSNYQKIDDYNGIKPENNPELLDFIKESREDGLYDYYFYSGEAREVFFKIDKDYKKSVYNGEYEPPVFEGADRITLKEYEAYIYKPWEGYVITLWITGEDNANHSNSGGFWNIGIVKESELYSNEGGVDVVGGKIMKFGEETNLTSTTDKSQRVRVTGVELGEAEESMKLMKIQ